MTTETQDQPIPEADLSPRGAAIIKGADEYSRLLLGQALANCCDQTRISMMADTERILDASGLLPAA